MNGPEKTANGKYFKTVSTMCGVPWCNIPEKKVSWPFNQVMNMYK